ncbi:hypothetical protein CLOSTHATH_01145 [Hungatella hathewayi DSM 13479]|uniref:Uncharacterized protein n=1 Tax=Hungatella hathewayi DSM 13479 TaxID=566550 RepID=D3AC17_9FIRM|nr:hypothetical protein CLOSTHATH_01145 [Hungatella hathewayi DSM 13479]
MLTNRCVERLTGNGISLSAFLILTYFFNGCNRHLNLLQCEK